MLCVPLAAMIQLAPVALAAAPSEPEPSEAPASVSAEPTVIVSSPAVGNGAPTGPQMSIAVANERTSTTAGDTLDYTISVVNLGSADIPGLVVTQTLPTGLTFGSADAGGTLQPDGVTWNLDVKATETATFHTTMSVVATPDDLLRLATVACASLSSDGPPVVCASESDQLPAGAVAEASQAAAAAPAAEGASVWWYVAGATVLVLVVAGLAIVLVRRRSADEPAD